MSCNTTRILWVYKAAFALVFVVLAVRLVQVQALNHSAYLGIARGQHEVIQQLPAPRGRILDRNLRPLADTVIAESVWLYKPNLGKLEPDEAARLLSAATGEDYERTFERLRRGAKYVRLYRQVSHEAAERLRKCGVPGLEFSPDPLRYYPSGRAAAQLIGFCNRDGEGVEGLELQFGRYLKGQDGFRRMYRDALGRPISTADDSTVYPRPGYDIVLTIDLWVQSALEQALEEVCLRFQPAGGVAAVMDVWTGEMLAISSYPFFDPNEYEKYTPDCYRNRFIRDVYEPGSMAKGFTALAALEAGVVTPETRLNCENGRYHLNGRTIEDVHPYGVLTFSEVIAKSSNVGTAKVAEMLGAERLYEQLVRLGFTTRTNIGLAGEEKPWLYPISKWSRKSLASVSFGYEFAVTPASLMRAYGAIAGDGRLPNMKVIEGVYDADGNRLPGFESPAARGEPVASRETLTRIRKILREVVVSGTCKTADIKEYEIAGKTGTANKVVNGRYDTTKTLGSFIGFAPLDNPRVLVLVSLDEPKKAHYGGTVAGPAVAETVRRTLKYLGYPPKTQ